MKKILAIIMLSTLLSGCAVVDTAIVLYELNRCRGTICT